MNKLDAEILKRFHEREWETNDGDEITNAILDEMVDEIIQLLRRYGSEWVQFMLDNDERMWGDTEIRIKKWIIHFSDAGSYIWQEISERLDEEEKGGEKE